MCLLCSDGYEGRRLAQRTHVLQLLALVEHPDALPAEAALRLAREVLALTRAEEAGRRCDPVAPPGSTIEESIQRRRS
ncbi:MAG: hypothetical protein JWP04_1322 [Belnapia sp.]|nr:hypothetical protein [Belnapia sp.]